MDEKSSLRVLKSCSDNLKPVLSFAEGSKIEISYRRDYEFIGR